VQWYCFLLLLLVSVAPGESAPGAADVLSLGEEPARQNLAPDVTTKDQLPGTRVYLRIEGRDKDEEFPLETLKKLRKKVDMAQQEDDIFSEHQKGACESNLHKFRDAQNQASTLAKEGKAVINQCKQQRTLAESSWQSSRQEERQDSQEVDTVRRERTRSVTDFDVRCSENQMAIDLLLKAGQMMCRMLKRVGASACGTMKEEPVVPEPSELSATAADDETREKHRVESERFEASKGEEWQALAELPANASTDPDSDGWPVAPVAPSRLGESSSEAKSFAATQQATREKLEHLLSNSVVNRKPMVAEALQQVLLAVKQGMFKGKKGAKRAEGIVAMVVRIRKQISEELTEDRKSYPPILESFQNRTDLVFTELVSHREKQNRLRNELVTIDNRTVMATDLLDWGDLKTAEAAGALKEEEHRCAGLRERIRLRDAERRQVLVRIHRVNEQIALKPMDAPYCEGGCGGDQRGACIALEGEKASCMCNPGFYGSKCESTMCPGFGGGRFKADMLGACNGGVCNATKGFCTQCEDGEYSGMQKACELNKCPSVDCSGHGSCDAAVGKCNCVGDWAGEKCNEQMCAGPERKMYNPASHNACSGRGACDPSTGECTCEVPFLGYGCELLGCLNDCSGHGTCDKIKGKCVCEEGSTGPSCELKKCPDNCSGRGKCNQLGGWCDCDRGFTGDSCKRASTCNKQIADWWTQFDGAGWGLCPKGSLMQGLYRSDCEALSCIEQAQCVAPCEGDVPLTTMNNGETGRCYHHSWVDSFDSKGWSRCNQGFFLAGLYRSKTDALFGIQLAKCCEIQDHTWGQCTEADWSGSWKGAGWSAVPSNMLLTGFYRNTTQVLSSITKASGCKFITTADTGVKIVGDGDADLEADSQPAM